MSQGGRGKEKRGDHSVTCSSSCQRKSCVGLSLRAVTERCLSPISGRRAARTLPCCDSRRRDTILPTSRQQSHTLPAVLRSLTPTSSVDDQQQQPLARQDSDDSAASRDSTLLECTHFGAEIRQIQPPATHRDVQTDGRDTQASVSSTNDHINVDTDPVCSVPSTENSPSSHSERDEEEEEKENGNPWLLRRQACSRLISRCNLTNKMTKTKILHRRHSHDCTPTFLNNQGEFPASLPVNLTVAEGLQLLDDGSPVYSGGSRLLSVVGHGDCHQKDAAAAADNSTSLCLAREILHELEEDLIESTKAPSSDDVPNNDCGDDQQMAAAQPALQQSSAGSDDVTVHQDLSGSPRCSNDLVSPPTCHCDSGASQTFGEVTLESNTSPSTASDVAVERDSSLHDASSAAAPASLRTSSTEPDTQTETIVGTLKNVFAYFVAKLGGHDRKGVQSDPHVQQSPNSPCDDDESVPKKHLYTHAVCVRDRKWLVRKNGASLSAAAHLAEILAATQKDCGIVSERIARPFGTLDRVLSLVPRRAVSGLNRRRRRRNTAGDIDVIFKLHRRLGDINGADQSAVVSRRPRSITISSTQDWIRSSTKHATNATHSSPSSSSSSHQSSFYERKMISDLEDVEGPADTDAGDAGRISVSASDLCDDDDDDAPVFHDATVTDVNQRESFSDLSSSAVTA